MILEPADAYASDASDAYGVEKAIHDAEAPGAIHDGPQLEADDAEAPEELEEALDDLLNDIEHEAIAEKAAQRPPVKYNGNTALEIAEQVHQVQEMLTAGVRPNVIRRYCADEWGLSTRTAEKRMADARRKMVTDANCYDRTEKVGQMLQQLEKVLEDALKMRQGSNAIGAIRLQADLLQLLTRQN